MQLCAFDVAHLCACVCGFRRMKSPKFPREVRRGSAVVRIYRFARGDRRTTFTVAWYVAGVRKMKQFPGLAAANEHAQLILDQLSTGRIEAAASVTVEDAALLADLRRRAGSTPVSAALDEWSKARQLVGAEVLAACRAWAEKHGGVRLPNTTVDAAVDRFIAAKKRQGVDVKASYLRELPPFVSAFTGQLLRTISHAALQAYLDGIPHPVTRNTKRKRIVALFRWARKDGILPQEMTTAAERTDAAVESAPPVGLVTPEQLRQAFALIRAKVPDYLPALTLAALCGLRRAEVHGQDWSGINLERKFLRVTRAKRGTPAWRIVPLNDAAVAWLLEKQKAKGPICENLAIDRVRDICRTAGLDLADNGLRHSYISARVAAEGDIPRIATDSGNSVRVIHRHYKELMSAEEGRAYLSTAPATSLVVVEMEAASA